MAIARNTSAHRPVKVFEGIGTDAVFSVGRNIGGMNDAEWRFHFQTTGERLAARRGMTGNAVAQASQIFALLDQVRIGRKLGGQC